MKKPFVSAVLGLFVMAGTSMPARAEGVRAYAEAAVARLHFASRQPGVAAYFWEQITNETIESARLPNQDAVVATFMAHVKAKDATAMFWLGNAYRDDRTLPKKTEEAIKWYEASASQGGAEAAGALYWLYKSGSGVPADYAKAYKWVHIAAQLGDPNAELERIVYTKDPKTTTFPTLIADFDQAAAAGDANSQYARCLIENHNIGLTGDRSRARDLCGRAAAQGHLNAQTLLALLLSDKGVYGPETLSALLSAARRGSPAAQYIYATARFQQSASAEAASKDAGLTAYDWMEKAAEQDYAQAQLMVCALAITASLGDADYARARQGYKWCYIVEVVPYYRDKVAAEKYFARIPRPGHHFLPFESPEADAAKAAASAWRTEHPPRTAAK